MIGSMNQEKESLPHILPESDILRPLIADGAKHLLEYSLPIQAGETLLIKLEMSVLKLDDAWELANQVVNLARKKGALVHIQLVYPSATNAVLEGLAKKTTLKRKRIFDRRLSSDSNIAKRSAVGVARTALAKLSEKFSDIFARKDRIDLSNWSPLLDELISEEHTLLENADHVLIIRSKTGSKGEEYDIDPDVKKAYSDKSKKEVDFRVG